MPLSKASSKKTNTMLTRHAAASHDAHLVSPGPSTDADTQTTVTVEDFQAAHETPTPKRQKTSGKYCIILLKDRQGYQYFEDKASASQFAKDFKEAVQDTYFYTNKKDFQYDKAQFEKQKIFADSNLEETVTEPEPNADDANLARNILESMNHSGTTPLDTISAYIYTNDWFSRACIIIRFLNSRGKEHWCWKPNIMAGVLSNYFLQKPSAHHDAQDPLIHLAYEPLPDPTDSTGETQDFYTYEVTAQGVKKDISIPLYVAYTFVEIPVSTLLSRDDEAQWLISHVRLLIDEIKTAMVHRAFRTCMTSINSNYSSKIFQEGAKKNNLPNFLKNAVVRTDFIDSLAPYIMRRQREKIHRFLLQFRTNTKKYTPVEADTNATDEHTAASDHDTDTAINVNSTNPIITPTF
jgi:hypothetical protein